MSARHQIDVAFTHFDLGADRFLKTGIAIAEEDWQNLAGHDAIFLGAMGDPRVPNNEHARAILLGMRFRFDLYVNLRPVKLFDARFSPRGRYATYVRARHLWAVDLETRRVEAIQLTDPHWQY